MTPTLRLIASTAFLLLGAGLLFIAFRRERVLQIDPSTVDLGRILSGNSYDATFTFRNRGSQTVRILGASEHCSATGCASVTENLPMEIPAGEAREIVAILRAAHAGKVAYEFDVYTDAPGQPRIRLRINGLTVAENDREPKALVRSQ